MNIATRGTEYAELSVLAHDECVAGIYDDGHFREWITVSGPPSVSAIVAALPGENWVPQMELDDWIAWAFTQIA